MAFMGYLSCKAALLESWWGNKDLKNAQNGEIMLGRGLEGYKLGGKNNK